jgi:hypothetical protein
MALIPRDSTMVFVFSPDDTPVEEDVSCYAQAIDVAQDVESIPVPTMCAPGATEQGNTTQTIAIDFLWEEALYTALQPHVGEEFELQYKPVKAGTKGIVARCKYSFAPLAGRWEMGQPVRVTLPLAVVGNLAYSSITAAVAP